MASKNESQEKQEINEATIDDLLTRIAQLSTISKAKKLNAEKQKSANVPVIDLRGLKLPGNNAADESQSINDGNKTDISTIQSGRDSHLENTQETEEQTQNEETEEEEQEEVEEEEEQDEEEDEEDEEEEDEEEDEEEGEEEEQEQEEEEEEEPEPTPTPTPVQKKPCKKKIAKTIRKVIYVYEDGEQEEVDRVVIDSKEAAKLYEKVQQQVQQQVPQPRYASSQTNQQSRRLQETPVKRQSQQQQSATPARPQKAAEPNVVTCDCPECNWKKLTAGKVIETIPWYNG